MHKGFQVCKADVWNDENEHWWLYKQDEHNAPI